MTFPEILSNLNSYINGKVDFTTTLQTFQGVELDKFQSALDTMNSLSKLYTKKQFFTLQKIFYNIPK